MLKNVQLTSKKSASPNDIAKILPYFYDIFGSKNTFQFPPGGRKLIELIVATIELKLQSDAAFFDNTAYLSSCRITSTAFGDVFDDESEAEKGSQSNKTKEKVTKATVSAMEVAPRNSAKAYSDAVLKHFVREMEMALDYRLKQFAKSSKLKYKLEVVGIDYNSVLSALISAKVHEASIELPNHTVRSATGTINCFCSTPPSKIKVHFSIKKPASIAEHLIECEQQNTGPMPSSDFFIQRITSWWSMSNLNPHARKHLAMESNGKQAIFLIFESSVSIHAYSIFISFIHIEVSLWMQQFCKRHLPTLWTVTPMTRLSQK